jgi:hypothetical protein
MYENENKQLLMVIFDGIDNSVFQSQVLSPLLKQIDEQIDLEVTLISFERKTYSAQELINRLPPHDRLHLILLPRTRFLGHLGLWISSYYFKKAIELIPLQKIIARGPLAGWLVLNFIKKLYEQEGCEEGIEVVIQARGLAAEEYRYECERKQKKWIHTYIYDWYYAVLQQIEYEVYHNDLFKSRYGMIDIEVVSPALKKYIIEHFDGDEKHIFVADRDLPAILSEEKRAEFRQKSRTLLNIPLSAKVYCYSGSMKVWQCIPETFKRAEEYLLKDPEAFFLLLVPESDQQACRQALSSYSFDMKRIRLCSVKPDLLLEYLSAADFGFLLRESDLVNWISRPTKALEYKAAGVTLIHNQTVDYVISLS